MRPSSFAGAYFMKKIASIFAAKPMVLLPETGGAYAVSWINSVWHRLHPFRPPPITAGQMNDVEKFVHPALYPVVEAGALDDFGRGEVACGVCLVLPLVPE